jgi:hypothetical protein
MSERHVCTRRYVLQLNSIPNIETNLKAGNRLGRNVISKNRESENRDWPVVKVKVKVKVMVKVKFTPEQASKAQRGSRGIALLFL